MYCDGLSFWVFETNKAELQKNSWRLIILSEFNPQTDYFTIYQCKGTDSRLVLGACERDFNDKHTEIS